MKLLGWFLVELLGVVVIAAFVLLLSFALFGCARAGRRDVCRLDVAVPDVDVAAAGPDLDWTEAHAR